MRCRKLRIVWSVFWGVACVLLFVLVGAELLEGRRGARLSPASHNREFSSGQHTNRRCLRSDMGLAACGHYMSATLLQSYAARHAGIMTRPQAAYPCDSRTGGPC